MKAAKLEQLILDIVLDSDRIGRRIESVVEEKIDENEQEIDEDKVEEIVVEQIEDKDLATESYVDNAIDDLRSDWERESMSAFREKADQRELDRLEERVDEIEGFDEDEVRRIVRQEIKELLGEMLGAIGNKKKRG